MAAGRSQQIGEQPDRQDDERAEQHVRQCPCETLARQFEQLDVTNELVDFALIGHDDEFAVARARIKSVGKPGGGFTDNTVDTILIFRQENAAWKLWDESILGVEIH